MTDFHEPGVYRSGRAWANAWDFFRRTPSRATVDAVAALLWFRWRCCCVLLVRQDFGYTRFCFFLVLLRTQTAYCQYKVAVPHLSLCQFSYMGGGRYRDHGLPYGSEIMSDQQLQLNSSNKQQQGGISEPYDTRRGVVQHSRCMMRHDDTRWCRSLYRITELLSRIEHALRIAHARRLRPILMRLDWKDRKGRFPIHYLVDGTCLDTFLIVSRIEFLFLFLCSFWGRLIRGSSAGESQLKTASCPARGF